MQGSGLGRHRDVNGYSTSWSCRTLASFSACARRSHSLGKVSIAHSSYLPSTICSPGTDSATKTTGPFSSSRTSSGSRRPEAALIMRTTQSEPSTCQTIATSHRCRWQNPTTFPNLKRDITDTSKRNMDTLLLISYSNNKIMSTFTEYFYCDKITK